MLPGLLAALLCAATEPLPLPPSDGGAAAGQAAKAPRKKPGKAALTGVLNVNRATEAELMLLPGIGRRRAARVRCRPGSQETCLAAQQRFHLFERKRGAPAAVARLLPSPSSVRAARRDGRPRAGAGRDDRGGRQAPRGLAPRAGRGGDG